MSMARSRERSCRSIRRGCSKATSRRASLAGRIGCACTIRSGTWWTSRIRIALDRASVSWIGICSARARTCDRGWSSARDRGGKRRSTACAFACGHLRLRGCRWSGPSTSGMGGGIRCGCIRGSACGRLFVPGIGVGTVYKYELRNREGVVLPAKADPYAFASEPAACVVERGRGHARAHAAARQWVDQRTLGADLDLRSAPRIVAAIRESRVSRLGRARRDASGLRGGSRLHAHRAAALPGAPFRWIVGLSGHGHVCADESLR